MNLRELFKGKPILDPVDLLVLVEGCARKTAQNKLYLSLDGKFEFPFPIRRLGQGRPFVFLDEAQAVLDAARQVAGPRPFVGAVPPVTAGAVEQKRGRGRPRKVGLGG